MYDLNANLHYLFNLGDSGFRIYPLGGFALVHSEDKYHGNGIYMVKEMFMDASRFYISGGITYTF